MVFKSLDDDEETFLRVIDDMLDFIKGRYIEYDRGKPYRIRFYTEKASEDENS